MAVEKNGNNYIFTKFIVAFGFALLAILNGLGIWILSDVKGDIRDNRAEFFAKMDNIVKFHQDEQKMNMEAIAKLFDTVGKHSETLSKHETLLHLNYPTRKDFFKEHSLEKK